MCTGTARPFSWVSGNTGKLHADPYTVRMVYWLVNVVAAFGLLILMLTWWPPPDRVFPRKKPVARLVPWCLVGREQD